MKSSYFCGIAAILLALAIVRAAEPELTGDLRAIQGKWRVWHSKDDHTDFEVKGNTFTMVRHVSEVAGDAWTGTFVIDEEPTPKHMTWTNVKNVRTGKQTLEINRCIYELHGDTWLLIGGVKDRPAHFYSGDGNSPKAWILQREK